MFMENVCDSTVGHRLYTSVSEITNFHSLLAHIVDSNVICHIGNNVGVNKRAVLDTGKDSSIS